MQTALDEEEASRIIARRAREFAYESESRPSPGERSEALADARAGTGEPRVQIQHASYVNPLQITLKVNFDFLVRLVEVIRDWARARADMWESEARLRRAQVDELIGQLPELSVERVQALLPHVPVDAITTIADSGVDIR